MSDTEAIREMITQARAELPLVSEYRREKYWVQLLGDCGDNPMVCFRKHYVDGICVGWEYAGMK